MATGQHPRRRPWDRHTTKTRGPADYGVADDALLEKLTKDGKMN